MSPADGAQDEHGRPRRGDDRDRATARVARTRRTRPVRAGHQPHRCPDRPAPHRARPAGGRRAPDRPVRPRARAARHRPGRRERGRSDGSRHRPARPRHLPVRRRAPRRPAARQWRRRPGVRPAGHRGQVLHLRVDHVRPDGLGGPYGRTVRGRRPAEPPRRTRQRGPAARGGLGQLRRARPDTRPARPDLRRTRPLSQRLDRAPRGGHRRRPDGDRGHRLAARPARGGHRPAVDRALAEHPDARHRRRLPRHLPVRGHQPLGGPRHHTALRDRRGPLHRRPVRALARRTRPARSALP